jgi:hypothetical protein
MRRQKQAKYKVILSIARNLGQLNQAPKTIDFANNFSVLILSQSSTINMK